MDTAPYLMMKIMRYDWLINRFMINYLTFRAWQSQLCYSWRVNTSPTWQYSPMLYHTAYPMGASLSLISCIHLCWKIYCLWCMWTEFPSFESSSVLYITHTYISSMSDAILQGMQQKLQKSCSRCDMNTLHVESKYISRSPIFLLLIVNRFWYTNNDVSKDWCAIPMDTIAMLCPLRKAYGLLYIIMDRLYIPLIAHYTASINCCKKHSIATKLRNLILLKPKSHLQMRTVGWTMCFLLMTFVPVEKLC